MDLSLQVTSQRSLTVDGLCWAQWDSGRGGSQALLLNRESPGLRLSLHTALTEERSDWLTLVDVFSARSRAVGKGLQESCALLVAETQYYVLHHCIFRLRYPKPGVRYKAVFVGNVKTRLKVI